MVAASGKPQKRTEPVDFAREVAPLLSRSCFGCHSGGEPKSGLVVTSRQALLDGGESGQPALRPGQSAESPLAEFIAGRREDMEMPPLRARKKYPALSELELATIRAWIEQGAPWPDGARVVAPD